MLVTKLGRAGNNVIYMLEHDLSLHRKVETCTCFATQQLLLGICHNAVLIFIDQAQITLVGEPVLLKQTNKQKETRRI